MKTNIRKPIGLLGAAITAIGFIPSAQATDPLIDPPRTEWGCELNNDKLIQGITAGLIGRGWIVTQNDGSGNLVAQVIVRGKHTLVVDIAYTPRSFDIAYKSSQNLDYKVTRSGSARIHDNANSWMLNIQNDIVAQLSALCRT
jgi:hypothetical protein